MFSIIIAAYHTKDFIEECIESIENQTYFKNNDSYEILIGIDGCLETLEKVQQIRKKYRNIKVFLMKKNYGSYVTINTLLSLTEFDNIIKFDSDDVMFDNFIEILSSNIKYDIIQYQFKNFINKDFENSNLIDTIFPGSLFYKKKIFEKLGGYSDWICAADSELEKRFLRADLKILKISKPLFYRRIHENSLTNSNLTCNNSQIRNEYVKKLQVSNNDYPIYVQPVIGEFEEIT